MGLQGDFLRVSKGKSLPSLTLCGDTPQPPEQPSPIHVLRDNFDLGREPHRIPRPFPVVIDVPAARATRRGLEFIGIIRVEKATSTTWEADLSKNSLPIRPPTRLPPRTKPMINPKQNSETSTHPALHAASKMLRSSGYSPPIHNPFR